jgi:hypothetical protein
LSDILGGINTDLFIFITLLSDCFPDQLTFFLSVSAVM